MKTPCQSEHDGEKNLGISFFIFLIELENQFSSVRPYVYPNYYACVGRMKFFLHVICTDGPWPSKNIVCLLLRQEYKIFIFFTVYH
jgi:hypothetical protein